MKLQLKNLKIFLLALILTFTSSFGWTLILHRGTSTETSIEKAKELSLCYSVGRANLKGKDIDCQSTRIANFIEKDKALVMLNGPEEVMSITCEWEGEVALVPISEVRLVKDYGNQRLVLCVLQKPLERIKPFLTPSVPQIIERSQSTFGQPTHEFILPELYCIGYGPNVKHSTYMYDDNYELKLGTIGLQIQLCPVKGGGYTPHLNCVVDVDKIGKCFEFSFKDSKLYHGSFRNNTPFECLMGSEDIGCPLFDYGKRGSFELIGIGFSSETKDMGLA